ncbi:MAG: SH3 domain-containing protein [Alphaproteobacteria bacterium]
MRPTRLAAALVFAVALVASLRVQAQTGDPETAIPRFVSLRSGEVNVRAGPGPRYPIKWVFMQKDMPVEVVAEYDTWRKVRDWEGSEGWIHRAMLSSRRSVIVTSDTHTIRREPSEGSPAVARLAPGMVAVVENCDSSWCRVTASGYEGWLPRDGLWGLYPGEVVQQ